MARILFPALTMIAAPALAHDGLHLHPHGAEYGWLVALLLGFGGGLVASHVRGRGK